MDFGLSDAQTMLRSSVRDLLTREVPIERVRKVMESDSGSDRAIQRALGDQGIAGLLVPEEHGGLGMGAFMAIQGLWAVTWMMEVEGLSRAQAASNLLVLSLLTLVGYLFLGLFATPLARYGVRAPA